RRGELVVAPRTVRRISCLPNEANFGGVAGSWELPFVEGRQFPAGWGAWKFCCLPLGEIFWITEQTQFGGIGGGWGGLSRSRRGELVVAPRSVRKFCCLPNEPSLAAGGGGVEIFWFTERSQFWGCADMDRTTPFLSYF